MGNIKDRELAYSYFVEQGLTAKETAAKTGKTEKTIGVWIRKYNWKEIRTAKESGPEKLLKNYYDLLNVLVEKRLSLENGSENPDYKGITDEISKISKAIENLKKEGRPSLRTHIYVIERFLDKLLVAFEKYKLKSELIDFTKEYIHILAKEQA